MHLNAYTLNETQAGVEQPGGGIAWVPARPEPQPWIMRLLNAWDVLQGRADSIVFPGQGKA